MGRRRFVATGELDAGELGDTLRVTLSTPGQPNYFSSDPTALPYVDSVLLNWITVAYPRAFRAEEGILRFAMPAVTDSGRAVRVGDLRTQNITVLDRGRTVVLTNVLIEADGAGFGARFAVLSDGIHLVFDDDAIRSAPPAERDEEFESARRTAGRELCGRDTRDVPCRIGAARRAPPKRRVDGDGGRRSRHFR